MNSLSWFALEVSPGFRGRAWRIGLLASLGMLVSWSAIAQTAIDFDVFASKSTDLSLVALREIVGDWNGGSNVQSILSSSMGMFCFAVLAFGAAIFGYTALVGTLQSAHDGQLLGKQWSSIWVPFRFTLGVGLLMPTASGLCAAQLGMLWLLAQGVGLASNVWVAAVEGYTTGAGNYIAVRNVGHAEVRAALNNILANEMCVAAMNRVAIESGEEPSFGFNSLNNLDKGGLFTKSGGRLTWGGIPGSGYSPDLCGWIVAPDTHDLTIFEESESGARSAMGSAQFVALQDAASDLRPLAERAVKIDPAAAPVTAAEVSGMLSAAASSYQSRLTSVLSGLVTQENSKLTSSMVKTATEDGWFTAGTWFYQIARINKELNDMASAVPTIKTNPKVEVSDIDRINYFGDGMDDPTSRERLASIGGLPSEDVKLIKEILSASDAYYANNRTLHDKAVAPTESVGSTQRNGFWRGMDKIFAAVAGVDSGGADEDSARHFGYDPSSGAPAIVQLKTVGDWMVSAAVTIAAGSLGGDWAASKLPAGKFVEKAKSLLGKAPAMLGTIATFVLVALFATGIILAFWLPLLPFVNWVGGLVGWVVAVMEMLIATPIWVAAHLHPDGDGVASRQAASGYAIILELLLRPVLMVFGLIIAMVVADPMLNFIASQFYTVLATTTADTISGIVTYVMKLILFATVCWMCINSTFKAINSVPHGVMKWIGGMQGAHSTMGDELGDSTKTIIMAGSHKITGALQMVKADANAAAKMGGSPKS